MENIGIYQMLQELKKLNPSAKFDVVGRGWAARITIYGTLPGESLKLPEGYYYNQKNGINDKHNTESGVYEYFDYQYDMSHFTAPTPKQKKRFWNLFQ